MKKSTFNNVCLNTFGLCKPSKLILRWRSSTLDTIERISPSGTHRGHCVVSLSDTFYIVISIGLTQKDRKIFKHGRKLRRDKSCLARLKPVPSAIETMEI